MWDSQVRSICLQTLIPQQELIPLVGLQLFLTVASVELF
jgi:hypothetical protein